MDDNPQLRTLAKGDDLGLTVYALFGTPNGNHDGMAGYADILTLRVQPRCGVGSDVGAA